MVLQSSTLILFLFLAGKAKPPNKASNSSDKRGDEWQVGSAYFAGVRRRGVSTSLNLKKRNFL